MTYGLQDQPCTGEPAQQSDAQVVTVIFTEGARTLVEVFCQPIEAVDFYLEPEPA